jgi:hypothetical protein
MCRKSLANRAIRAPKKLASDSIGDESRKQIPPHPLSGSPFVRFLAIEAASSVHAVAHDGLDLHDHALPRFWYTSKVAPMRRWRNWQTHKLEVLAPQGIGVQVPSSAPNFEENPLTTRVLEEKRLLYEHSSWRFYKRPVLLSKFRVSEKGEAWR